MTATDRIKTIQRVLEVTPDGQFGPKSRAALSLLIIQADSASWRAGLASSFADSADIKAFKKCKAGGKSDQACFKVGDNGVGCWGDDTTADRPMCALPPEDFAHLAKPRGALVEVLVRDRRVVCELRDRMPARKNIKNGAVIDLNAAAWRVLGFEPPVLEPCGWRWV